MNNLEDKILAFSAKLGNEVHLKTIRNTFISMLGFVKKSVYLIFYDRF